MTWINNEFWSQLTVGLAGGLLGILGTFLIAQWSERKKPKQQLSFDLHTRRGLGEVGKDLSDSVKILYKGSAVAGLYISTFTIENTGTTVVRDQQIRFKIPKGASVLETALDPAPEIEWGVKPLPETEDRTGPIYSFGHLEKGSKVTVRLVLASEVFPDVQISPFNPSGDVAVVRRTVAVKSNAENRVKTALFLLFMLAIVPRVFSSLGSTGELAESIVTVGIIFVLLPYSLTLLSVVTKMITRINDNERQGIILHSAQIQSLNISQWSEGSTAFHHRVTLVEPEFTGNTKAGPE